MTITQTGVCPTCGYNLPHHRPACADRPRTGTPAVFARRSGGGLPVPAGFNTAEAIEWINAGDMDSPEHCAACDHRFGHGKAKADEQGRIVHRNLDCTNPRTWA